MEIRMGMEKMTRMARTRTSTRPRLGTWRLMAIETQSPIRLCPFPSIQGLFSTTPAHLGPAFQSNWFSPTLIQPAHPSPNIHSDSTTTELLVRAGFIRQSSAGIWTFLPNAIRVLAKIESIVRREMESIHACEISMPLLQTANLWKKSGRWDKAGKELFRLSDRKGASLLLAPTHEEEVTQLIKTDICSSKQLPLRLFHIGRKFRDEARPRAGLLRSREFIMKDLYTFDLDPEAATKSYLDVQAAYRRIFEKIGVPFSVAEADSGAIGGSKSHEYHFKSPSGEDTLIHCPRCSYTANLELARSALSPSPSSGSDLQVLFYTLPSTRTFLAVVLPISHGPHLLKLVKLHPDISPLTTKPQTVDGQPDFEALWDRMAVLIDASCTAIEIEDVFEAVDARFRAIYNPERTTGQADGADGQPYPRELSPLSIWSSLPTYEVHEIRTVAVPSPGSSHPFVDLCPSCAAPLEACSAIEVAHTFHLGDRYSAPFGATIAVSGASAGLQTVKPLEMGCHGIGVSRLLSAIAECCADKRGLRWPVSVAPFKACIVIPPNADDVRQAAGVLGRTIEAFVEGMKGEVVVDDRKERVGWKLMDAELVGYPFVIILASRWLMEGVIEVRRSEQVSIVKEVVIGDDGETIRGGEQLVQEIERLLM